MSKKKKRNTRLKRKITLKKNETISRQTVNQLLDEYLRCIFSNSGIHKIVFRKHCKNAKFKCLECGEYFNKTEMEIDHIDPVHPVDGRRITFEEKIDRMLFCGLDNFQPVCKPCHKAKSRIENTLRRNNRK